MLEISNINNDEEFNQKIINFKYPHILQSVQWSLLKEKWGWKSKKYLFYKNGKLVAACNLLLRKLPLFKRYIAYCPRGPLFNYEDSTLWEEIHQSILKIARQEKVISLKIDPELRALKDEWADFLLEKGWHKAEEIQFRNTAELALADDEDTLLKAMKSKTRYNIRLAAKKGVRVSCSVYEGLEEFFDLYEETGRRDGFLTRSRDYYLDMANIFLKAGMARLFLARKDGILLSGAFILFFQKRFWYFYGASSSRMRNLMAPYLLHWEIIRYAKGQGYKFYDMWGAPDILCEDDPLWGVFRFKKGFNADFIEQPGAYDYVLSPFFYFLTNRLLPGLLNLKKKLHYLLRKRSK